MWSSRIYSLVYQKCSRIAEVPNHGSMVCWAEERLWRSWMHHRRYDIYVNVPKLHSSYTSTSWNAMTCLCPESGSWSKMYSYHQQKVPVPDDPLHRTQVSCQAHFLENTQHSCHKQTCSNLHGSCVNTEISNVSHFYFIITKRITRQDLLLLFLWILLCHFSHATWKMHLATIRQSLHLK